jgi:predicted phage terminase large subunit-like protein
LAKDKPVRWICLPAEISERVRPADAQNLYRDGLLDPVRMPQPVLDSIKVDLGSYGYAGQFDQAPAPAGGGMVKRDWFPRYSGPVVGERKFYLDTAYTAKQSGDPSGILGGVRRDGDLLLTSYTSVRLEFPELVRFIPQHIEQNGGSRQATVVVEPKASGLSVIQELRRHTALTVIEDKLPPGDKVTRTAAQSATYEAGRVRLPEFAAWVDGFLDELAVFPAGKHDEAVDCLNGLARRMLLRAAHQGYIVG